jgi:Zn-dependent M28 family amino/carboxypeptidase/Tol biopolymer transport system component
MPKHSRLARRFTSPLALAVVLLPLTMALPLRADGDVATLAAALDPREVHLADLRQLTFGGENAEAYWSPDGRELTLQRTAPGADGKLTGCDQIFRLPVDRGAGANGENLLRVSNGSGRTTCSYFYPQGDLMLFSSTHAAAPECPPPADMSQGYVWPIYSSYEIYTARPDGSDVKALTKNEVYDAEATVCPKDGSIVFTSTRDGDLELYRMDADGSNVKRLTSSAGYDGGAFFSEDCQQIVWRSSRPQGKDLEDYQALLAKGLVRPSRLELYVANADGSDAQQVTYLGAGSFGPYFIPDAAREPGAALRPRRILFASNTGDPKGREFDIWAINADGTNLERITYAAGFDGFPMFSPDGRWLAFSSNRHQKAQGETDVYVARWLPAAPAATADAADRYRADVAWLADDAREGRGIGTAGLDAAATWLEGRFRELGLTPAGSGEGTARGYRLAFEVPVAVERLPATRLLVDGSELGADQFVPAVFSASRTVAGELVFANYGITAPDAGVDDYANLDVKGKVVVVRRYAPTLEKPPADFERRFSDLRYKTFNAREHGAVGLLVVDLPPPAKVDEELAPESPLPNLRIDGTDGGAGADAGLPVAIVKRAVIEPFLAGGSWHGSHRVELTVALRQETKTAYDIVGVLPATAAAGAANRLPGTLLLGAHYDHLGFGGAGSLAPEAREPHNGADDNASGVAGILEATRLLAAAPERNRDVWVVAFAGEESGLLGSTALTRHPPADLALGEMVAMLNLDMVGRLRQNTLSVLGVDSAKEWRDLVTPACGRLGLACSEGGDGYGPSDQTPFYAAGTPVLFFFTGAHAEYHKPTDDTALINAAGGARIAALVADLAAGLANRPGKLAYQQVAPPAPQGDLRSYGASLGTIPDYVGPADGRPGVLLAGVRTGSAAEKAGFARGDIMVELAGHPIRDIHDFMFVLRSSKPGQEASAVVERDGKRVTLQLTFGESRGTR